MFLKSELPKMPASDWKKNLWWRPKWSKSKPYIKVLAWPVDIEEIKNPWGKKIHGFKETAFQKICKEMNTEMIKNHWYRFCEFCLINNSIRWEHHHIIFRSEKPRHEFLNDKRNILHLCIKCHNEFHKHKHIRDEIVKERKLNELFWNDILCK